MNKLLGIFIIVSLALLSCNNQTSRNNASTTDTIAQPTVINESVDSPKTETKEDLVSNSSDNSNSKPTVEEEQSNESLTDILKRIDKAPQAFTIASNKDTTIFCSEGTSIKLKGNSFVSETTGKEITGRIKISIKEYYKLADMLFANLSTTSGKDILETGGMIYIGITSDNENCILKKGNTVDVGFPYRQKKEKMQLFRGA